MEAVQHADGTSQCEHHVPADLGEPLIDDSSQ